MTHWTIQQLAHVVQAVLAATQYPGAVSGRVRDLPDPRTIRYYTTLGMVDRPAELRGRTAYYGRRHVLQLALIKHGQAAGRSLGDLQRQLIGADEEQLAAWIGLPQSFWAEFDAKTPAPLNHSATEADAKAARREMPVPLAAPETMPPTGPRRAERFWARPTVELSVEPALPARDREADIEIGSVQLAWQMQLGPGLLLLIQGRGREQPLTSAEAAELAQAAAALRNVCLRLGLSREIRDQEIS